MEFGHSLAQIPKPYSILYMSITSITQIPTPYKILYKPGLYEEFNRGIHVPYFLEFLWFGKIIFKFGRKQSLIQKIQNPNRYPSPCFWLQGSKHNYIIIVHYRVGGPQVTGVLRQTVFSLPLCVEWHRRFSVCPCVEWHRRFSVCPSVFTEWHWHFMVYTYSWRCETRDRQR